MQQTNDGMVPVGESPVAELEAMRLDAHVDAAQVAEAIDETASSPKPKAGQACYQCGMEDHIARNCPSGNVKTCFNCAQKGHISKDCTNPADESAPKPLRRRPNQGKCYNCGDVGHFSKACPQKDAGPKCYSCGHFGHISSACEDAQIEAQ
mmetsp:Transcript_9153/g.16073  ORF Transcript_9153/g.16073 Transcript_9153/m.16073 type:complete len:151 (+) Transcript_9153:288-740(+)|eukprot:CAMPEP_0184509150 /NCGR_PEP_ID=MMETSP0198_2-20121128/1134_1 /TAXON_ID=1112570 /ORGANISM="Thraustochytrium sp., Strain LLF1b" /LENGTH=150 /DNA_ID=CAMNT_0026898969 /DNA_START=286 /DNA_END=738 /DNA_ORIENTATION=+